MKRYVANALDEPFVTFKKASSCAWPWCTRPMPTDDSELAVHADVHHPIIGYVKGVMHVCHSNLAPRFARPPEYHYEEDENDIIVNAESAAPPARLSDPMSEDEAIAHARRGKWVTCVTPEKKRNRLYVVAE